MNLIKWPSGSGWEDGWKEEGGRGGVQCSHTFKYPTKTMTLLSQKSRACLHSQLALSFLVFTTSLLKHIYGHLVKKIFPQEERLYEGI